MRRQTATINAGAAHPHAATWKRPWLLAAILVVATALCYLPAFRSGFVWDDKTLLTENPRVQAAGGIARIWRGTDDPDYFPLSYSSLWLEWRLWGMDPAGYHVTNVLLHALAAVLLWRLLLRLRIPGAWWAAMLFVGAQPSHGGRGARGTGGADREIKPRFEFPTLLPARRICEFVGLASLCRLFAASLDGRAPA